MAVVFNDRRSYIAFAQAEVGEAAQSIIGYFSLTTNRMTMYDLTGVEALDHGRKRGTQAEINQVLSQPDAERTVATIVHEATHQIAFNCGLHTRLSDCPHWFSEGIAIYFEAPDLSSPRGWRNVAGSTTRGWWTSANCSPGGRPTRSDAHQRRQPLSRSAASPGGLCRGLGPDLLPHPPSIPSSTSTT